MNTMIKPAWLVLALLHALPATVLIAPHLTEPFYGVSAQGDTAALVTHRGALFLAIAVCAAMAAFHVPSRQLASLAVAISLIGFLLVYTRAGFPSGPLQNVAILDTCGLLPLLLVTHNAWR